MRLLCHLHHRLAALRHRMRPGGLAPGLGWDLGLSRLGRLSLSFAGEPVVSTLAVS